MNTNQLTKEQQIYHSLIYMLPVGLGSLLPFITIPIFTRILSPEDYGVLALAMIYAIIMSGLSNFGMTIAFERNYFQYRYTAKKLAQLFYSSLVFVLANFAVLIGITYLFKENISELLTKTTQHGSLILATFAAHFFFSTAVSFFFIYFKNEEKAKLHTKYRIINNLLNVCLGLFFVVYLRVGVIGIVLAQLISGVSLFILLLYLFLKELRFSLNKKILLESLKIAYPRSPRIFLGVLNTQFDKYMIGLLATIGGVGIYHIGKKISELTFTFMTAIENVFNPQIYQRMFNQHEQGSESIGRYLTPFLYISVFIALCVALFSEELLTVLTPASYHGAIPIISILSIYFSFLFFGKITGIQLLYSKKTHITAMLTFLSVGINVGFNIPFIMWFGAIGAAAATMLAGLTSGTISLLVAQHYYRIHYEWNKIAWIMGTFFIGSTIIATLHLLDAPYYWSLLVKLISISAFILIGIKYGIVSKENFIEVKSIMKLRKIVTA